MGCLLLWYGVCVVLIVYIYICLLACLFVMVPVQCWLCRETVLLLLLC